MAATLIAVLTGCVSGSQVDNQSDTSIPTPINESESDVVENPVIQEWQSIVSNGSEIKYPKGWSWIEVDSPTVGYISNQENLSDTTITQIPKLKNGEVQIYISRSPHDLNPARNFITEQEIISESAEQYKNDPYFHCSNIDRKPDDICKDLKDVCTSGPITESAIGSKYLVQECSYQVDDAHIFKIMHITESYTTISQMTSLDVNLIDKSTLKSIIVSYERIPLF